MLDKLKNYKLQRETVNMIYGSVMSITFLIVYNLFKKE
jgi:hypothetical protein